jgi:deoxyribonuclease V
VTLGWPATAAELVAVQRGLGEATPPPWSPPAAPRVGGCFVCFARGIAGAGEEGDPAVAAAAVLQGRRVLAQAVVRGAAGAPYLPAMLALREGRLLEAAVRALDERLAPEVLLVNASGRDHPHRAGLALHLGAVLGVPTVGVTNRPLAAEGEWPAAAAGSTSPLRLGGDLVGYWLRARRGSKPVAVHAAWRTDPEVAVDVVRAATHRARTPEPLRRARTAARAARGASGASGAGGTDGASGTGGTDGASGTGGAGHGLVPGE